jgi:beta-glucosidase/6-phospho-beta-glucosidase/beta-galactosidase
LILADNAQTGPQIEKNGQRLFQSFWMAGFECSCHVNRAGRRLDMIAAVQHDLYAEEDYALLPPLGIRTARDGVRWHLIDRGADYDFRSFEPMLKAAVRQGVQVIWDLFHYGFPDDVDMFSPRFVDRFARYARAVAKVVADHTDEVPFYAPVNEISFFAWAGSRDYMAPFAVGRDDDIKRQLVRACIAASDAIRDVDSRARLVIPDPVLYAVAPRGRPDLQPVAAATFESQFEGWDMLAGRAEPELGGDPRYLDIIGCNFYGHNEWEQQESDRVIMCWEEHLRDTRYVPLRHLLAGVYARYERPLFLAETGHYGAGRVPWLRMIAREAYECRRMGIPLEGVCLYPILDRYDWDDESHWHNSGLWDLAPEGGGAYRRILNQDYADELRRAQELLAKSGAR